MGFIRGAKNVHSFGTFLLGWLSHYIKSQQHPQVHHAHQHHPHHDIFMSCSIGQRALAGPEFNIHCTSFSQIIIITLAFTTSHREGVKKQVTVRQTVRGGGRVSHLGPDRKQMWKFWSFFIEIWFFDTLNTFYRIVGSQKMHFSCPFTSTVSEISIHLCYFRNWLFLV